MLLNKVHGGSEKVTIEGEKVREKLNLEIIKEQDEYEYTGGVCTGMKNLIPVVEAENSLMFGIENRDWLAFQRFNDKTGKVEPARSVSISYPGGYTSDSKNLYVYSYKAVERYNDIDSNDRTTIYTQDNVGYGIMKVKKDKIYKMDSNEMYVYDMTQTNLSLLTTTSFTVLDFVVDNNENIFAVGKSDSSANDSLAIYKYTKTSNSWTELYLLKNLFPELENSCIFFQINYIDDILYLYIQNNSENKLYEIKVNLTNEDSSSKVVWEYKGSLLPEANNFRGLGYAKYKGIDIVAVYNGNKSYSIVGLKTYKDKIL